MKIDSFHYIYYSGLSQIDAWEYKVPVGRLLQELHRHSQDPP